MDIFQCHHAIILVRQDMAVIDRPSGEVFDGDPAKLAQYTWRADAETDPAPSLAGASKSGWAMRRRAPESRRK